MQGDRELGPQLLSKNTCAALFTAVNQIARDSHTGNFRIGNRFPKK